MSEDEQMELALAYKQSRELLEQTRDYLLRLPPVPVTREFAERIDAHLNEPAAAHARRAMDAAVGDATRMNWSQFMPNGEPFLGVRLEGRTLTLIGTGLSHRPKAAKAVIEALDHHLTVKLEPVQVLPLVLQKPIRLPEAPAHDHAGESKEASEQALGLPLPFNEPRGAYEEAGWEGYLTGQHHSKNPFAARVEQRVHADAWAHGWDLARVAVASGAYVPSEGSGGPPPGPAYLRASDYLSLIEDGARLARDPLEFERLQRHIKLTKAAITRAAERGVDEPAFNVGERTVAEFRARQRDLAGSGDDS